MTAPTTTASDFACAVTATDGHTRLVADRDWTQAVHEVDAENTRWLTQVIAHHGWPGARLVGPDGAHVAWLITQHVPARQRTLLLPLLRTAVEAGVADALRPQAEAERGDAGLRCCSLITGDPRHLPSSMERR
ncbi:MAG: DUF6624 domain-containing protein [Sciscionella sp.]